MKASKMVTHIKNRVRRCADLLIRRKANVDSCVILCNNCIGGFLYNDYGMRFDSPTVNLQLSYEDFLKFAANVDYYLQQDIVEMKDASMEIYKKFHCEEGAFPIGQIDDIKVYFQHYTSFDSAVAAWERRKRRYYDCIIAGREVNLIFVTKECDAALLHAFESLPQKNKIMLTESKIFGDQVFNFDLKKAGPDWYTFQPGFSLKKTYEQFDFSKWLR